MTNKFINTLHIFSIRRGLRTADSKQHALFRILQQQHLKLDSGRFLVQY